MSCSPSSLDKYTSRPGPPIPATLCTLGDIKLGNDINVGWNSKDSRALDPK